MGNADALYQSQQDAAFARLAGQPAPLGAPTPTPAPGTAASAPAKPAQAQPRGFLQDMPNEPIVYGLRHGVATLGMGAQRVADGLHDLVMGKSYDEKVQGAAAVVNGLFQMGISPFTAPAASIGKALEQSYPELSRAEILDPKFAGFIRTMMGQIPRKPTQEQYAGMSAEEQAAYKKSLEDVSAPFTFREGLETAITMAGPLIAAEAMRKPTVKEPSAKPAAAPTAEPTSAAGNPVTAAQTYIAESGPYAPVPPGVIQEIGASLPPLKEGVTRLYRAEDPSGRGPYAPDMPQGSGRYFTSDLEQAIGIAKDLPSRQGRLVYLDVPTADAAKYQGEFAGNPLAEHVVPGDVASGRHTALQITPEQAQAFVDRVQSGTTPEVPPPGTEGPRVFGINWQRLGQEESVNRVILDLNQQLTASGASAEAARGVRPHATTTEAAKGLAMTVEDVLRIQPGTAVNAETMTAIRGVRDVAARSLTKQAEMAIAGDTAARADIPTLIALNHEVNLRVKGVTAEAGRTLESMKMPSDLETSGTSMTDFNNLVDRLNGMTNVDKAAEMIQNLKPRPVGALRGFLSNVAEGAKTGKDIVWEVYVNSLLSGPATLVKKVLSDGLRAGWELPQRAIARLNHVVFFPSDPLGVAPGETTAMARGLGRGFATAIRSMGLNETDLASGLGAEKGYFKPALTAENIGLNLENPVGRAVDFMGSVVRAPGHAIGVATDMAKSANYQMELSAQAVRQAHFEGLTGDAFTNRVAYVEANPAEFPQIADAAQQAATVNTFTQELGPFGQGITKALNAAHLRGQVPFLRIPLNLSKFAVQATPGFNIPSLFWGELSQQIKMGGAARELALAKVEMGGLTAAALAYYVANGQITGEGPKDAGLREERRALGIPPYSIRVGDEWYKYNLVEPIGGMIALVADTAEVWAQVPAEGESLDRAMQAGATAAIALGHEMSNKPFFTGIKNVLDAIEQPTSSANIIAKGWARSIVPALVRRGNQAYFDTTMREARTPLDALKSVTPGYSADLPPHRNPITGKPVFFPAAVGPDIASPISYSEQNPDPVFAALVENQISVKPLPWVVGGTAPPLLQMKEQSPTEGIPLTPQQRDKWITLMTEDVKVNGLTLYDQLDRLIRTPAWQTASSGAGEGRDALVQDYTRAYREAARLRLLKEDKDLQFTVLARQRGKIEGKWLPTTDPRSPQFNRPGNVPPELGNLLESLGR